MKLILLKITEIQKYSILKKIEIREAASPPNPKKPTPEREYSSSGKYPSVPPAIP